MSDELELPPIGEPDAAAPSQDPYAGLPEQAAKAMRTFELVISALLLTAFLALLVNNHLGAVGSVAPIEAASLDSYEGWSQHTAALLPLGMGLGTLALIFVYSWGARLWRSLREGIRRRPASTLPLQHFLLAFGTVTLVQGVIVAKYLPQATLTIERGPTAVVAELETVEQGRALSVLTSTPRVFGDETLPLEGRVALHREAFATWLVVGEAGPAVTVDGARAAPGETVQVRSGAKLVVGPYTASYRAPTPQQVLTYVAIGQLVGLVVLLLGCRTFGGDRYLTRVGLTGAGFVGEVGRGVAAWCAFLPIYVVAVVAGLLLAQALDFDVTGHSLVRTLEREGLALAPLIVFQAAVLAPLAEEIQFRGFLLQGFSRPLGYRAALWVSALAFGCIHDGLGPLLPMTALGFLFGGLFLSSPSRSLVGAITAHALHNAANLGIVVLLVTVSRAG